MPHKRVIRKRGNKHLGILENGVLRKTVRNSTHLYRKLDAWAFDTASMRKWLDGGLQTIILMDVEENVRYTATMEDFQQQCLHIHHEGHGPQLALPRIYWNREDL